MEAILLVTSPTWAQLSALQRPVSQPASESPSDLVLDLGGFTTAVLSLDFSPDGRWLAAGAEKEVRIWDLSTGQIHATLRGRRERNLFGNVYAVAFSPDGKTLVAGIDDYSDNGSIRIYSLDDLHGPMELLAGHNAPVRSLAFSRDGKWLVSIGENGRVIFWDWTTRRRIASLEAKDPKQPLYWLACFPGTEPYLMLGEPDGVSVVSVQTGQRLASLDSAPRSIRRWFEDRSRQQLPDGGTLARASLQLERNWWIGGGESKSAGRSQFWAAVWNLGDASPFAVYRQHRYLITALATCPSKNLAASADLLGDIHVWNLKSAQQVHRLTARGRPIYAAKFSNDGQSVAFGVTPHGPAEWSFNRYGALERVFDFERRVIKDIEGQPTDGFQGELTSLGNRRLKPESIDDNWVLTCFRQGLLESRFKVRSGAMPTFYTFLPQPSFGVDAPVVFGDDGGVLLGYDATNRQLRRDFVGHRSFITSVCPSPDGRRILTASTDHTIRIWDPTGYTPAGDFDFDYLSDRVTKVPPSSSAARAGVQVGDRIVSLEGKSITEIENRMLMGIIDFRPKQRVRVQMERGGRPYEAEMVLKTGPDVVEPLISMFFGNDGEWIVWTPQGYYDCSPGADQLIGWHVNQGVDRPGKFYHVEQFRKQLHRPDVIDRILLNRNPETLVAGNGAADGDEALSDLRKPEVMKALEPPVIEVLGPRRTVERINKPKFTIRTAVHSVNRQPVQEVAFVVNGRPLVRQSPKIEGLAKQEVTADLPLLPGKNEILVMAASSVSHARSERIVVDYQPDDGPDKLNPDLYVLAIGIGEYRRPDLNLQFSHIDARRFIQQMELQQGRLYGNVHSRLLENAGASGRAIRESLEWLVRSATQHDVAVLFLSAHGFRDSRQNFFFATHEVDPDNLRASAIPFFEFQQVIRDLPCKVLVFIDSCHSGGVTGAKGAADDPLRDLVSDDVGAIVFASCMPREISLEHADWGHGAFSKAIFDTLADKGSDRDDPGDGHLRITELDENISRRVKKLTRGEQHPVTQKPPTVRDFNLFALP